MSLGLQLRCHQDCIGNMNCTRLWDGAIAHVRPGTWDFGPLIGLMSPWFWCESTGVLCLIDDG